MPLPESATKSKGAYPESVIGRLAIAAACVAAALTLGGCNWGGRDYRKVRVPSASMEPTVSIGQRIDVDEAAYHDAEPKRGDIVVFHPSVGVDSGKCGVRRRSGSACPAAVPRPSSAVYIKRIVALPGDRLKIVGNRTYIDGVRQPEGPIRTRPCNDICNLSREIVIPPGTYFTLGDNRGQSDDSRIWGPVRRAWIVGKARL